VCDRIGAFSFREPVSSNSAKIYDDKSEDSAERITMPWDLRKSETTEKSRGTTIKKTKNLIEKWRIA